MIDLKQLAENLRRYNAWRRGAEGVEMPSPKDLGTWIDSAIAVVEAHAGCNPLARQVETPSSHWSADGKPDPHGKTYDCERAGLHMGNMTDDELANGAFLNYDQPLNVAGILAGTCHSPIAWMTAVKDRIRWLSRSLEKVAAERDALAAELTALGPKGPSYMPNWTNHGAAIADPVFHQIRGIMGTQNWGQEDALRKAVLHALRAFQRSVEASNQPTEAGYEND